ncbi:hypothetical protein L3X38_001531 [Prunus dulcis]|uniref:Retrovirus-related Pol polyprotein from transposon TNT 1-94-like beta-barrel domain-containing protein n=1 Tax=Prunus dulcis TaxID=3755 RepID=A0AAD4WSA2_PRUDU|nr:hypothetical protein L3X38_001531 [Prunus dulcis]
MEPSLLNMFILYLLLRKSGMRLIRWFMMALTYPSFMSCIVKLPISSKRVVLYLFISLNLKAIWFKLDKRRHFQMKCADDIKILQAAVMVNHAYEFLAGLDDTYDKVRKCIFDGLSRGSTLDYYAWIRHQDLGTCYCVCFQKHCSRFLAYRVWLFYCSTLSPDFSHVAVVATSVADVTTRHGQLTTKPAPAMIAISSTPTPSLPGNFGRAFHAYDTRDISWIIDSGSTDNMTYNSTLFSTTLLPHRDHVLTANNVAAPITGASSVLLTPALPLDKVLLISSLSSNLLSMAQVTEQLNCVVLMYPSFVLL